MTHTIRWFGVMFAALLLAVLCVVAWIAGEGRLFGGDTEGTLRFSRTTLRVLRDARHDHYELRCSLAATPANALHGDELLLAFGVSGADDGAILRWNRRGIFLKQRRAGRETMLVEKPDALTESLASSDLLIRVMNDEIEVVSGGRRLLRAFAPGLGRGAVACGDGRRHVAVNDLRYQRLEPFRFADDFMRTEEEAKEWGQWRPLAGDWKIYSVMELIHDNPAANIRKGREPLADRSPNPFCLSGSAPDGPGMIVTGLPFWCDYRAAVSVKPFGGAFGLVFGYRDAGNHWLLRWSANSLAPTPAPLELVVREQGVERVVGSVMLASRAENWWRLGVKQQGDRVDALVDGVVVLSCRDQASVGGAVGLYKDGAQEAYFDDLEVASVSEIACRRLLSEAGRALAGKWRLADDDPVAAASADCDVLAVLDSGASTTTGLPGALYQIGWPHWAPQRFAATVLPAAPGPSRVAAGLVFGLRDEQNYWCAGWSPAENGRLFLQQVRAGRADEVLALPYAWSGEAPLFLAVDSRQDGVLELWANDALMLRQRLQTAAAGTQAGALGGAVGLFGAEGAQFTQVRAFAAHGRDWEQPVDIARFADDPFMQGWASSRYSWLRDDGDSADYPRRYRHNGDFYGAFTLIAPLRGGFKVFWGLDDLQPAVGYALQCELSPETDAGTLKLLRGGEALAEAAFSGKTRSVLPGKQIVDEKIGAQPRTPDTETWGQLELRRDGHAIWGVLDGEELFCVHDPAPLTGRCFGVEVPAAMDFIHLDIRRERLRDYLFERAETDWNSVGRWEVTNRFACDPRWSHMNGESRGVAALWSKFALAGDFTIECFAGMRMRQGELQEGAQMSYPRVGDINVAVNGDGRELFSGYNLLVAAWDERWSETWTQFWRRDAVVAQTDRELIPRGRHLSPGTRAVAQEWDPGGRPVHGAWYALKIRRTGSRYDVSFDNTPVFSYTDDEPISGGKLSLWTQHNSIVLARVKVSYRDLRLQAPLLAALPGEQQGRAQGPDAAAAAAATADSGEALPLPPLQLASHPTRVIDFEDSFGGVEPWHGDQSAQLRRQRHDGRPGQVLAAENINSGGDFGLALPWADVALHRVADLRLACLIPAGSLVNLYFTVKDDPVGRYFIRLTGPGHDEANLHCVGAVDGLRIGEWSELNLAIGELLRARFPRRDQWLIDSAMIGMLHEGYLNAGLGGNYAGAKYYVDDIVLVGYGPQAVIGQWQLAEGQAAPSCHAWISQSPDAGGAVPAAAPVFSDASFTLVAPQAGPAWLLVETLASEGQVARRLPAMPLLLAAAPPPLPVLPAAGESWGLNPLRVALPADKLSWPCVGSMILSVNGQDLPLHDGNSVLDASTGVLEIQPRFGEKIVADADGMVAFTLSYLPVAAPEKSEPTRQSWRLRLKPADDRTPPGPPQLAGAHSALCGLRPWLDEGKVANAKSQADIQRYRLPDGTPAARVTNRICGSDFGLSFNLPTFELARYPVLLFDYKIHPDSHVDLLLRVLGKMHSIGLTDLDPSRGLKLGDCPGIVADDSWRSAQLDLREYSGDLSVVYDGTGLATTDIALGNWHYSGEAAGNHYEVSRVMLAPLVNSSAAPPKLSWQLPDPGDITAYSYQWDRERDSVPDTTPEGAATSTTMPELADGLHFFHIRACDQAGNWGATAHYPFLVENGLPTIASVLPEDGGAAAPEQIELTFADDGTDWLDFSKVKVKINGDERRLDRYSLQWDRARRTLSWNLLRDWGLLNKAVADGTLFTAEISGIRSFAGREIPAKSWQWRLDYAQDKTPPQPPMVVGNDNVFQNTESFSGSHNWRGQPQTNLAVVQDDAIASQCLEIRYRAKDGGRFQANAWLRRDTLKDSPALRFRYQIAPGTKVNLLLLIEREWYSVRMTGSDEAPLIGAISDARDDGQWRWAWLDLPELIAKAVPDKADARLLQVAFGERGAAAAENVLRIDDFSAVGVFGPLPLINLQRTDASGIAAHEAKLSTMPDDEPQVAMSSTGGRQTLQAVDQEGLWFVHARCRDGAGNNSETIHIPFLCREPATAQPDGDGWETATEGIWRLRAVQRSQSANATLWPIRAGESNRLLGLQFYGGRSQPMELYREVPDGTVDAWKTGIGVDLFLQGAGEVEVRAALYLADQTRPVLSQPLIIKGGDGWQRGLRLLFTAADVPAKGAARHVALRLKRNERTQATLLVDACRWLTPNLAKKQNKAQQKDEKGQ
ncbi:hypothetical protein [Oligosphaera ethanolica]|uniref:Uncharacterized protein n=1 Tax=Oligosphaera ethanolica TaxID=760260 RepID=A0AAE3VDH4_9BACT|nr:hypothetical protein [Oligosphaera ethanolica]MDQ0288470.1 hypothetical protein [Oligosphaera ethanolica]